MKLILQRVSNASVLVDGKVISSIDKGVLILFGVEKGDGKEQVSFLVNKTLNLRVFPDENGKMNFSCIDVRGDILVVSQFTLLGDCSRGRRPGFDKVADPDTARDLYEYYVESLCKSGLKVDTGKFGANMKLQLVNDGPVTFLLES